MRILAGMGRQVADKSYFLGLLNTQLSLLQKEIDSLSEELLRAEKEQQNLLVYEQRYKNLNYTCKSCVLELKSKQMKSKSCKIS